MRKLRFIFFILVIVSCSAGGSKVFAAEENYHKITVRGWTLMVHPSFYKENKETGDKVLEQIDCQLYNITRSVQKNALSYLKQVTIWVNVKDKHGNHPIAVYHPSKRWLKNNGYNPEMAKCVEVSNASNYLRSYETQPMALMHELAHAYNDQFLNKEESKKLADLFKKAKEKGLYKAVQRLRQKRLTRAYALNNTAEYFSEATEALFGMNDYYPFVSVELRSYDPELYTFLKKVWKKKKAFKESKK